MSPIETALKSIESKNRLKVIDKNGSDFIVKNPNMKTAVKIEDTFAELFPMWMGRILVTANTKKWALTAARTATGFAASVIMSPAEAGIEKVVSSKDTPDRRPGAIIQIYHVRGRNLKAQMITRIGQCIMTCPTTAAFDALTSPIKRLKVGRSLSLFGDGFQKKDLYNNRNIWRIPVMEGEFIVEDRFGVKRGVAGGNFLILARDVDSGLKAAEAAVEAIKHVDGVILPFPGGVCRSGSKVGSLKYKLQASTNHFFCPTLRSFVSTKISGEVNSVYEIVINGLSLKKVKMAMGKGINAATSVLGVIKVTAANYGGRLGPYRVDLKDILN